MMMVNDSKIFKVHKTNLKTLLENLLSLGATDGAVDGNLFVTSDTERSDSVASLRVDGRLAGQLFQHFGSTGQSVTRFTDANVQAELADSHLAHRVLALVLWCDDSLGSRGDFLALLNEKHFV